MKTKIGISPIIVFAIITLHLNFQPHYFEINKINCGPAKKGYKVILEDNPLNCLYDPDIFNKYGENDKLGMIKELLSFQGDTSSCVIPIMCYSPLKSQIYQGERNYYTIQLEAFFLINQIIFNDPFLFSPYPIIYNANARKILYGDEPSMVEVFDL